MHLAQINVARAVAELDSPVMAGFVSQLAEINALADRSPGFVWRLQTDAGDATAVRAYGDPRIIVCGEMLAELRAGHQASPTTA